MSHLYINIFFVYLFLLLIFKHSEAQTLGAEQIQITTLHQKLNSKEIEHLIDSSKQLLSTDSDSAIKMLYTSLNASILIGFDKGIDSALSIMSNHWYKSVDNNLQYALLEATIKALQPVSDPHNHIALLYYISGRYLSERGLYSHALIQQQKALGVLSQNDKIPLTKAIRAEIYNQLGAIWILLEEPNQAMIWWNKAEELARAQNNMHQLIRILRNKGTYYYNNGQLDTSYQILMDAYNLGKTNADIHQFCGCIRFTVSALCLTLLGQHKVNEALMYLNEEIKYTIEQKKHKADSVMSSSAELLHLYFLKGYAYFEQGNYTEAEKILLPTLASAQKQNFFGIEKNIVGLLSMLYDKTEQYKKAYKYLNDFNALDKKIIKDQKKSAVDFHIQYLENEKQKELAQQQAKLKNRNMLIGGAILTIVLLCTLFAFIYYNVRRRQSLKQELIRLQAIMQGEEKERTRLAHELHDGIVVQFSAVKMNLSTLPNEHTSLRNDREYEYIVNSLDEATKELRKTAHHLMPDMLLEDGLKEAAYYFCKTLVASNSLNINFQHFGNLPRLDTEFELSLYRIIQELVQNIIKHAEASEALVQISYFENSLNITVEDNGKGFDTAATNNGMGLRSIRARVKALKGNIDIQSTIGKGTIIYMEFETSHLIRQLNIS